jgi:hypothetical protein
MNSSSPEGVSYTNSGCSPLNTQQAQMFEALKGRHMIVRMVGGNTLVVGEDTHHSIGFDGGLHLRYWWVKKPTTALVLTGDDTSVSGGCPYPPQYYSIGFEG